MSTYTPLQGFYFSCTEKKSMSAEHYIPVHGVAHVFSGEMRVVETENEYVLTAGQTVLFRRNRLAKFTKHPAVDAPFRSVTLFFQQPFLTQYFAEHPIGAGAKTTSKGAIVLERTPLLDSLVQSLLPYEDMHAPIPEELIALKLSEALAIVRAIEPTADSILTDFSEPGKIDLADFMLRNYAFNINVERFAYLTGRSLATFKRDFQKIFKTSPQKWLLVRRLQQAHFLIAEKQVRPSDAYIEVGFENLSHFSFAFKQQFGYNASSLSRPQAGWPKAHH